MTVTDHATSLPDDAVAWIERAIAAGGNVTDDDAALFHSWPVAKRSDTAGALAYLDKSAAALAQDIVWALKPEKPLPAGDDDVNAAFDELAPDLEDDTGPTSWTPVDLAAALEGRDVDPPIHWARADGVRLIYEARLHWLQGPPESMKSLAAQHAATQAIEDGVHVLYIDFEDDAAGVVARLLALGATPDAITAHLCYVRPDEALRADRGRKVTRGEFDLQDVLASREWGLCILDGVTEALAIEGMETNSNDDIATWMRLLPKRISSMGIATIVIDHTVKSAENAGRYAIGGQHKLAGVTGAAYKFEVMRPLGRPQGEEPEVGQAKITVVKDRPGFIRGRSTDGIVGIFEVVAYADGGLSASIVDPESSRTVADMATVGAVLAHLDTYDGASKRDIESSVEGRGESIRAAMRVAVQKGWVRVEKIGRTHHHYLTEMGRDEL